MNVIKQSVLYNENSDSKQQCMHSNHILYIPIYIQQDATLHSLFYLETALHVSGGTTTHHQESKQLYLQHLVFVKLVICR